MICMCVRYVCTYVMRFCCIDVVYARYVCALCSGCMYFVFKYGCALCCVCILSLFVIYVRDLLLSVYYVCAYEMYVCMLCVYVYVCMYVMCV